MNDFEATTKIEAAAQTLRQVLEDNATLRAELAAARAERDSTQLVLDETVSSMGQSIVRLESNLAAAYGLLRELRSKADADHGPAIDSEWFLLLGSIDAALAGKP